MNNLMVVAITQVLNNKHEFLFCDGVEDLLVVSLGSGESDSDSQNLTPSSVGFFRIAGEGASDMSIKQSRWNSVTTGQLTMLEFRQSDLNTPFQRTQKRWRMKIHSWALQKRC